MFNPVVLLCFIIPAVSGCWFGAFKCNTTPEQIHIALAGQDDSGASTGMRIAWYTQDKASASQVKLGTQPGHYTQNVPSAKGAVQYLSGSGYHHLVTVVGLPPSTKHYYRVGSDKDGWSEEWSFKTAPTGDEAANSEISVSIFGDIGYLDSVQRPSMVKHSNGLEAKWDATMTRNRLESLKPKYDFMWILGDIAYADDAGWHNIFEFLYEDCFNGFMNWFQNISAAMPLMVSPGNHESECHSVRCVLSNAVSSTGSSLRNFTAYNSRFHMPSAESVRADRTHSMWYSFNYGPVHFVSINTETDWHGAEEEHEGDSHLHWPNGKPMLPAGHFDDDGAYLRWLETDLASAAKARSSGTGPAWIVVGGHRPYGDTKSSHVPLFEKYGVDLYFAGHAHSYSRSKPVNNITYVVVGGAGCDEMPYPNYTDTEVCVPAGTAKACDWGYKTPAGAEVYTTGRMATGILKADRRSLNWQLYDSKTGVVLDEFTISEPAATNIVV